MPESWNWLARKLDEQAETLQSELVRVRRHLHANPEPSGEERETTAFLAQRLKAAGLVPNVAQGGLGLWADVSVGPDDASSPLVALRADLDALRLQDEKTVEYRSQRPGVCHACGHDAHTTIVLGVGLATAAVQKLARRQRLRSGAALRLRLVFQPAEETSEGARWLVEQGVLDGVHSIVALHVDPERLAGQVAVRYGALTASCDEVCFTVSGQGGHAARPHHAVDSVAAGAQLVTSLYQFLPRSVDSRDPAVFTIGQLCGGYAANVIPERVTLRGSLRTTSAVARETLKRRIGDIVDGVEELSGARIEYEFVRPLSAVVNDPRVTAALEEAATGVVGQSNVVTIERPSMGGEDFSVYLERVPGAMARLGCCPPGADRPVFLHSPRFDLDERVLLLGTRLLLRAALLLSARTVGEADNASAPRRTTG